MAQLKTIPAPPPLKPEEEKENGVWLSRLSEASKHVEEHRRVGRKIFDTITGSEDAFIDDEGKEIKETDDMVQMRLPLLKNLLDAILPQILANEPSFFHKPQVPLDGDLEGLARVSDHLIQAALREHDFLDQTQMMGKEGLLWPLSAMEVDYDSEIGLPRATWHPIDKIRFDPRCNGLARTMQWGSVDIEMPIEDARRRFKAPWLQPDASSVSRSDEKQGRRMSEVESRQNERSDPTLDLKKLTRIWVRGDSPLVDDTKDSEEQLKSPERESGQLKGKNEMLIFDQHSNRIIHREPWPFILDIGRLPIFFFVSEPFPGQLATIGTFEPFIDLQNKIDWLYSLIAGGVKNGASSVFFYDKNKVADEGIAERLSAPRNLQGIGIDMSDVRGIEDIIKFIPMQGISDTAINGLNLILSAFENSTQSSDLRAEGVAGIEKATTATLADQRVRNRLAQIAKRMERFVTEVIKAMSQIARSVMTVEDVAKWVPPQILNKERTIQNLDGSVTIEISPFWPDRDAGDDDTVARIRGEMDIEVHPGSLRELNISEQLQNENFVFQTLMASIGDANALLSKSGREINPDKIIGAINHYAVRVGELLPGTSTTPYQITAEDIQRIPQTVGPGELQADPGQIPPEASADAQLRALLGA